MQDRARHQSTVTSARMWYSFPGVKKPASDCIGEHIPSGLAIVIAQKLGTRSDALKLDLGAFNTVLEFPNHFGA